MNYLLWNIRGLEIPAKRRMIAEVIRSNSIEVACLEETKLHDSTPRTLREIARNEKKIDSYVKTCGVHREE